METEWAFNSARLKITLGIPGDAQEGGFMNATLQSTPWTAKDAPDELPELDFSIAVHVEVPRAVVFGGETALADYLGRKVFGDLVRDHPEVSVEIQIGPHGDGEEWDG